MRDLAEWQLIWNQFPLNSYCHGLMPFALRLAPVTADSYRSPLLFYCHLSAVFNYMKGTSQEPLLKAASTYYYSTNFFQKLAESVVGGTLVPHTQPPPHPPPPPTGSASGRWNSQRHWDVLLPFVMVAFTTQRSWIFRHWGFTHTESLRRSDIHKRCVQFTSRFSREWAKTTVPSTG